MTKLASNGMHPTLAFCNPTAAAAAPAQAEPSWGRVLAHGQAALTIEFAAPSPLGLLTPVLEADLQPAPARDRESLVRPAGVGTNQMRGK